MSKSKKPKKTRLTLHLGSREEALNLYSILVAFQVSDGAGILNQEALATVGRWVEAIEVQVPGIKALAGDTRGPYQDPSLTDQFQSTATNLGNICRSKQHKTNTVAKAVYTSRCRVSQGAWQRLFSCSSS